MNKYGAGFCGTSWLILDGCAGTVLAAAVPNGGMGPPGASDKRAPQGFAPIAIGLRPTLIHLTRIREDDRVGESRAEHGSRALRRRRACGRIYRFLPAEKSSRVVAAPGLIPLEFARRRPWTS